MLSRLTKIAIGFIVFILFFGIAAFTTVTLLIRSEKSVVVPQLVGKDVSQVLQTLSSLGLNTQLTESKYSETIPRNHVIFQDPSPGTEIKSNRSVRIILSKGTPRVLIPDLTALPLSQALIALEAKNLCAGQQSYTQHADFDQQQIVIQFPSPGVRVDIGQCVDLLISAGPHRPAHLMPDLTSRSLDDALAVIENMNLILGRIETQQNAAIPRDAVIEQLPEAGYRIKEGSQVHLVINKKTGNKDKPLYFETGFVRHRVGEGFLKKHVKIRLEGFGVADDIMDTYVLPGKEVWVLVPTNGKARVSVYEDDKMVATRVFD